ncbi:MAG: DNA cytosine methyltransferase [Vallitaleaceae bacterium]|nr:DNA cytosine methyltransferase [Vallitaleaceae bacterium]
MRVIDLFCGSGGFSEGFRQAGFDVIWAVDKWEPAVITHSENHPNCKTIQDDVISLSNLSDEEFDEIIPDSEVIIGSPPCIAFSNSNRSGKGDKSLGVKLFESYLRIIFRKKYKKDSILQYWILENVPNIGNYIKEQYSAIDLGLKGNNILKVIYENSGVYNAKYYGVATNRKRFFCGEFPTPKKKIINENSFVKLRSILDSLGEPKVPSKKVVIDPNYPDNSMNSGEITDHHYIREIAEHEWKKAKRLKQDKGYMGKMSFPEDMDKPSRTVMAMESYSARESLIFPYKENRFRAPTIRELASLMSFPIEYRFYGKSINMKHKLVGNAVPPKLSYALAKAIMEQEKFNIKAYYQRINHKNEFSLRNLNFKDIPLKIEKPKQPSSKFKYHLPYFIINTFRVELTNYHSDFKGSNFKWDIEIHMSQGPKARVFKPRIDRNYFEKYELDELKRFLSINISKVSTANKLQKIYCMTEKEREQRKLYSPMGLLEITKNFIENINIRNNLYIPIKYKGELVILPYKTLYAYYALRKLIKGY